MLISYVDNTKDMLNLMIDCAANNNYDYRSLVLYCNYMNPKPIRNAIVLYRSTFLQFI